MTLILYKIQMMELNYRKDFIFYLWSYLIKYLLGERFREIHLRIQNDQRTYMKIRIKLTDNDSGSSNANQATDTLSY
jgi:hypothetical protein